MRVRMVRILFATLCLLALATSAWRLPAHLGAPGIEHAVTIEEPPADDPAGTQLPLI
jgi:hypothetical protein